MENTSLSIKVAKHLLKRVCRAISSISGTKVYPSYYSNGMLKIVSIVSDDREIAIFTVPNVKFHRMYFANAYDLLQTLTSSGTIMYFSPLGKDKVRIDTSKTFGTSIDELSISLDLMDA